LTFVGFEPGSSPAGAEENKLPWIEKFVEASDGMIFSKQKVGCPRTGGGGWPEGVFIDLASVGDKVSNGGGSVVALAEFDGYCWECTVLFLCDFL